MQIAIRNNTALAPQVTGGSQQCNRAKPRTMVPSSQFL